FHILSDLNKTRHGIMVSHTSDVLLDNRIGVQLFRYIMAGRTDYLYSSLVCSMVGLSTNKRGQKRVVDVNNPMGKMTYKIWTENLHVPRQNHKLDLVLLVKVQLAVFLFGFICSRYWEMMERYSKAPSYWFQRSVVRNDQGSSYL